MTDPSAAIASAPIGVEAQPHCPLCAGAGAVRYQGLTDRLFGAPGAWSMRQCGRCRALWLDPRPTEAELGKAYATYYTHGAAGRLAALKARLLGLILEGHAAGRFGFRAGPFARTAALAAHLKPGLAEDLDLMARHLPADRQGEGRLLDLGCGGGAALLGLRRLGWSCSGVDVDPKAVAAARSLGLDVRQGPLAVTGLPAASFDAVTSSHVIEHVHDPLTFLVEARTMLKPGGALVAVTPNAACRSHARFGALWIGLDPPRHLVLFDADNLADLARRAGFSSVQVTANARAAALSAIAAQAFARHGDYVWGAWPGWVGWLRAQAWQARQSRLARTGDPAGEELVLTATAP